MGATIERTGATSTDSLESRSRVFDQADFWVGFDRAKLAELSAEQIADLSRTALRGYDACTAGDERFNTANFFRKLDASAYSRASDIFRSGAFDPPGAKK